MTRELADLFGLRLPVSCKKQAHETPRDQGTIWHVPYLLKWIIRNFRAPGRLQRPIYYVNALLKTSIDRIPSVHPLKIEMSR